MILEQGKNFLNHRINALKIHHQLWKESYDKAFSGNDDRNKCKKLYAAQCRALRNFVVNSNLDIKALEEYTFRKFCREISENPGSEDMQQLKIMVDVTREVWEYFKAAKRVIAPQNSMFDYAPMREQDVKGLVNFKLPSNV